MRQHGRWYRHACSHLKGCDGGTGNTIGFWTEYKTHPNQKDWMLALVRRHECWHPSKELDKWCSTDLYLTQVHMHLLDTKLCTVGQSRGIASSWHCSAMQVLQVP